MELKEYLEIIKKDIKIFLGVVLAVMIFAFAYFYGLPESFEASLTLNITRTGTEATGDYRYDGFYRLQADDKFSETVVEWLKSPRVVSDIFSEISLDHSGKNIKALSKSIQAEKRSSQLVAVKFEAKNREEAERLAGGIIRTLSRLTDQLNLEQKEKNWFKIVGEKPVILLKIYDWKIIILAAFLLGIFLSFWTVMIRHYFR